MAYAYDEDGPCLRDGVLITGTRRLKQGQHVRLSEQGQKDLWYRAQGVTKDSVGVISKAYISDGHRTQTYDVLFETGQCLPMPWWNVELSFKGPVDHAAPKAGCTSAEAWLSPPYRAGTDTHGHLAVSRLEITQSK